MADQSRAFRLELKTFGLNIEVVYDLMVSIRSIFLFGLLASALVSNADCSILRSGVYQGPAYQLSPAIGVPGGAVIGEVGICRLNYYDRSRPMVGSLSWPVEVTQNWYFLVYLTGHSGSVQRPVAYELDENLKTTTVNELIRRNQRNGLGFYLQGVRRSTCVIVDNINNPSTIVYLADDGMPMGLLLQPEITSESIPRGSSFICDDLAITGDRRAALP